MTVNSVGFYLSAVVIVLTSLAVVIAPAPRQGLLATAALAAATAVLLAVAGSDTLAVLMLLLAMGLIWAIRLLISRGAADEWATSPSPWGGWWPIAVGVVAVCATLVIAVEATQDGSWHRGVGVAALPTLLHYRFPLLAVAGASLLLIAAAGAWILGSVSSDERRYEESRAQRKQRQEQAARRRSDRAAAQQKRRQGRAS